VAGVGEGGEDAGDAFSVGAVVDHGAEVGDAEVVGVGLEDGLGLEAVDGDEDDEWLLWSLLRGDGKAEREGGKCEVAAHEWLFRSWWLGRAYPRG
jgi:hypothetical protein